MVASILHVTNPFLKKIDFVLEILMMSDAQLGIALDINSKQLKLAKHLLHAFVQGFHTFRDGSSLVGPCHEFNIDKLGRLSLYQVSFWDEMHKKMVQGALKDQ